jgi:hypothetical protein
VVESGDKICEPLSVLFQAAAHLLPIVNQLLLQALFTEISRERLPLPPSPVDGLASRLLLQALFTESLCGEQLLAFPLLWCTQSIPPSLLYALFSSLFIIQFFFFGTVVSLSRGLCWLIPEVVVGVLCVTYFLTCWSESPKQVWSWCLAVREPACFLSITWHEEVLCWLGVEGVRVLFLLGGFFLPSVAPASQQDFWFMALTLSTSSL